MNEVCIKFQEKYKIGHLLERKLSVIQRLDAEAFCDVLYTFLSASTCCCPSCTMHSGSQMWSPHKKKNHLLRGGSWGNVKWGWGWLKYIADMYKNVLLKSIIFKIILYLRNSTYIGKTLFCLHLFCGSGQHGRSHLHGSNRTMHYSPPLLPHLGNFVGSTDHFNVLNPKWHVEMIFDLIVSFRLLYLRGFLLWYWGLNLRPFSTGQVLCCWAEAPVLGSSIDTKLFLFHVSKTVPPWLGA